MTKRLPTFTLLALIALTAISCAKLQARDNLNKGIKAFRDGRYDVAVEFFKTATEKDPELTNAELYLGTAYAQQFIPGAPSEENQKYAQNAIDTFKKVLERDPKSTSAVAGLAGIYSGLQQLDKAREYYKKHAELDPTNAIPFYSLASTDWIIVANKQNPLPDDQKGPLIEEGMQNVDKALQINPDYDDAMTYKNLLLRQKAELSKDEEEKKRLMAEADDWSNKALATRLKNQQKNQSTTGAAATQ